MREIIELNRQILTELPKNIPEDFLPGIDRADGPQLWPEASATVKQAAEAVHAELNRYIPEDFGYAVLLGDERPCCHLIFEDGQQTAFGHPVEISEHASIEATFAGVDWDEHRGAMMSNCQIFDDMKAFAEGSPSTLPTTAELQTRFAKEMEDWISARGDTSEVKVFLWRPEDGFVSERYSNLEELSDVLPDIMAVELFVIAVVADGKPLSVDEIDVMKNKALQMMKEHMPISYARATGRFAAITEPIDFQDEEVKDDER